MNNYTNATTGKPWLLIAIVALILTTALIVGIKFFVGSEAQESAAPNVAPTDFKFQGDSGHTPGYSPISHSETGSAGSLEMFKKTNAGYYKEDSSSTESGTVAAEAPKTTKPAVSKTGAKTKSSAASIKRTVIPKMQTTKGFGTAAAGTSKANAPKGAATPDISTLMKQALQKKGQ
ncbi:MAG: hypothetical protein NTX59_05840 [Elusimicrobia bacterium]|nr:hypothetical protein [Elusimicrobiota bacterium]